MEASDSDKHVEEKRRVLSEKMIVFPGRWAGWSRRAALGGDL